MDKDIELEAWSYMKMCMSSHDKNGKIVLNKTKKARKKKCPFGKRIVSSPFFRSIVYQIDYHIENAVAVLDYRKRDLEEFNHYVQDQQVDDDHNYRHELGREIVYWMKMIEVYREIKENKEIWFKEGKFPWSGLRVSTPYYDAPPVRMAPRAMTPVVKDEEMTPIDAESNFLQIELTPVTKSKKRTKRSRV